MRPPILLLTIFLAVLPLSAIVAIGRKPPVGAWEPIQDVHDPHVQFIAEIAVSFYDLRIHGNLNLKDVVRGETQAQATRGATKYLLHLIVEQPSSPCYKAMVLEKLSKTLPNYRELLSFEAEIC